MLEAKSHNLTLRDFQNRVRGSGSPYSRFAQLRPFLHGSQIPAAARWVRTMPGLLPGRTPTDLSMLACWPQLPSAGVQAEALWAAATSAEYASRLNRFAVLANTFENAVLTRRLEDSLDALDQIDKECGVSLWAIENRFAVLQHSGGLEQQKAYAQEIARSRSLYDIVVFLSHYLSQRNEDSSTPQRFMERLSTHLNAWEGSDDLKSYLTFHLTGSVADHPTAYEDILRYEASASIVDYYDSFIRLSQMAVSTHHASARYFIHALQYIARHIRDHRIQKLLYLGTGETRHLANIELRALEADDALACGRYEDANWFAYECLSENPRDVSNWFSLALASAQCSDSEVRPHSSLAGEIVNTFRAIITRDVSAGDASVTIGKTILNFRLCAFSAPLQALLDEELSSTPTPASAPAIAAFTGSPFLETRMLFALPNRQEYELYLRDRYGAPRVVDLEAMRCGEKVPDEGLKGCESAVLLEAKVAGHFARDEFASALALASELEGSQNKRFARIGARFASHCLLRLGHVGDLVDFVARQGVGDPGLTAMLPLELCANSLTKEVRKQLAGRLAIPIVLDFYSRYVSDNLQNIRAYAYEDFLCAHGLQRPSELRTLVEQFPPPQLTYYLRYICVPENMQMSIAFTGTRDLEDERLAVCELLAELDPTNADAYNDEIRNIVSAQTIISGVRHAEQSKIYVDTSAAYRWAERNLKENYQRYQALLKAGLADAEPSRSDLSNLLQESQEHLLAVPKDEAFSILVDLFRTLLEEATSNPQFGLDCYLSMRIRHGTLSGQLRSPLVEEHVITQRQSDTNSYESNEYWLEHLDLAPMDLETVDQRLSTFSRDWDHFIEGIAQRLIQIRSAQKPEGLFDFQDIPSIYAVGVALLAERITPESSFDDFLSVFFEFFWHTVDRQLKRIRTYIDTIIKPEMNGLFVALESDLLVIGSGLGMSDLHSSIKTAQTGAQHALDQVKDWFKLTKPAMESSFTLDQLVDIGIAIVKKIHRDFEPHVVKHVAHTGPVVGLLTNFSDMLFIVFDNIRRHSGLERPEVVVTADFRDLFHLRIENEIDPSVRNPAAQNKVAAIKEAILHDGYQAKIASEGGTGFIKIRKIIGPHQTKIPMDFGFTDHGTFFVEFQFLYSDYPE